MHSISFKKSTSILSNTIISTRTILDNIPERGVLDPPVWGGLSKGSYKVLNFHFITHYRMIARNHTVTIDMLHIL